MSDQERALRELQVTGVDRVVRRAIQEVYPRVSADHDIERGHDGNTFGTMIWRELEHEVTRGVRALLGVSLAKPAGSFCVVLPSGRRVFLRKYGPVEAFDIQRLRWDGELRASLAIQNASLAGQAELAFVETSTADDGPPLDLVLAHTGHPELGSTEAFIGAPQLRAEHGPWVWLSPFLREANIAQSGSLRSSPATTVPARSFAELPTPEPVLTDVEAIGSEDAGTDSGD